MEAGTRAPRCMTALFPLRTLTSAPGLSLQSIQQWLPESRSPQTPLQVSAPSPPNGGGSPTLPRPLHILVMKLRCGRATASSLSPGLNFHFEAP